MLKIQAMLRLPVFPPVAPPRLPATQRSCIIPEHEIHNPSALEEAVFS
jgi:hypothetical protein